MKVTETLIHNTPDTCLDRFDAGLLARAIEIEIAKALTLGQPELRITIGLADAQDLARHLNKRTL